MDVEDCTKSCIVDNWTRDMIDVVVVAVVTLELLENDIVELEPEHAVEDRNYDHE